MAAKQSAEMRKALALCEKGVSVYRAAARAGVTPSGLYKSLISIGKRRGRGRPKKEIDMPF